VLLVEEVDHEHVGKISLQEVRAGMHMPASVFLHLPECLHLLLRP
jgi:hypothetical protein